MTADDIISIQQAVAAYGAAIDSGDMRYFDYCFAPDAELWLVGHKQTVADYVAQCQKAHGLLAAMQHHCAATFLDSEAALDGSIEGRTPFVAYHFAHAQDEPLIVGGEYVDVFRPTESGWRIAKRTGRARWQVGDLAMLTSLMD